MLGVEISDLKVAWVKAAISEFQFFAILLALVSNKRQNIIMQLGVGRPCDE